MIICEKVIFLKKNVDLRNRVNRKITSNERAYLVDGTQLIGGGLAVGGNRMTKAKIADFAICVGCPAKVFHQRE